MWPWGGRVVVYTRLAESLFVHVVHVSLVSYVHLAVWAHVWVSYKCWSWWIHIWLRPCLYVLSLLFAPCLAMWACLCMSCMCGHCVHHLGRMSPFVHTMPVLVAVYTCLSREPVCACYIDVVRPVHTLGQVSLFVHGARVLVIMSTRLDEGSHLCLLYMG